MSRQTDSVAARLRGCVGLFVVWLVFPLAAVAQGGAQVPGQLHPRVAQQIQATRAEKASWTMVQRKIDSKLLLATKQRLGQATAAGLPALRQTIQVDQAGLVLVDIKATVTEALLARIAALGGQVVNSFANFSAIRAKVPLAQIQTLAAEDAVRSIRPADRAITRVTSQGDAAHKANQARALGVDGTGVRVGVLSDSVDALPALQASGELPEVTILPGQSGNPGTSEGTAMLEIIHDLAPGAQLFFATAANGPAAFAQNILNLRAAGCDVLVDDIGYIDFVFQDGIIAQAVDSVVADGAVYFSAAGNDGNLNDGTSGVWEGDFVPTAAPPNTGEAAHDFGGGSNFTRIVEDPPFFIELQWSDAGGSSNNDYDLYLLSFDGDTIIDASTNIQDGDDVPFEVIDSFFSDDTTSRLVIVRENSLTGPRFLHLNTAGGMLAPSTDGQIFGHPAATGAFAVAAVPAFTAGGAGGVFDGSESVEEFSSDGPRRVFYQADGTPITPGNFSSTGGALRMKPDIAAADGVSTATPGFDLFFGTSAAAPHAAAIAALVKSNDPTLTPADIRTILTTNTLDIEAPGFDRDSGFGILDAHAAVNSVGGCTPPSIVCQDLTRTLINNNLTVSASEINNGSTPGGVCTIFRSEIMKSVGGEFGSSVSFDCGDVGAQQVTFRVTQFGGLTDECTATVTIMETDIDQDGTGDCSDNCPDDPAEVDPGICGCGVPETDTDGDGVPDCIDNCVETPNPDQLDSDRDGTGDACRCDKPGTVKANIGDDVVLNVGESKTLGGGPTAVGGVPPYQYQWTIQGVDTMESFTSIHPVFTAVQPGTFTANLVVSDTSGCTSSASLTIVVNGTGPGGFFTDGLCAEDPCGMVAMMMPLTLVGIGWLRRRGRVSRKA